MWDMNATYKKWITVHFFLLHRQKDVVLNHTNLEIKKKKKNSDCLLVPSLLPLDSFVFSSCMRWFRQIEPLEVSMLLHVLPDRSCTPGLRLSFVRMPDEGWSNRTGRNTWTSRITFPWIWLECSWRDALGSLPRSGERLEVTALKYSSLGAINSSWGDKDKWFSMSYQWSSHCWSNLRTEG